MMDPAFQKLLHYYNYYYNTVLLQTDLENTLGEIASLGAAGVVLWGEIGFAKSEVSISMQHILLCNNYYRYVLVEIIDKI